MEAYVTYFNTLLRRITSVPYTEDQLGELVSTLRTLDQETGSALYSNPLQSALSQVVLLHEGDRDPHDVLVAHRNLVSVSSSLCTLVQAAGDGERDGDQGYQGVTFLLPAPASQVPIPAVLEIEENIPTLLGPPSPRSQFL